MGADGGHDPAWAHGAELRAGDAGGDHHAGRGEDRPDAERERRDGRDVDGVAGDLDKAVAGLLTNGYVATAVDGQGVPAAFTRIAAFRAGLATDDEGCYKRYQ